MLEFLLEPASIAVLGTVGSGVAIKIFENLATKRNEASEIVLPKVEPKKIDIPDAEKCIYFGHRQLEWSAAQNGDFDMVDGLTCMEPYCPNCTPIKEMYRVRQTNQALIEDGKKPLPMPEYKHIYPVEKKPVKSIPTPPKGQGGGSKHGFKTVKGKDGRIVFIRDDLNRLDSRCKVCESIHSPHCRVDTRPPDTAPDFQKFQWLKRNDPRYSGYRFEDYEFQQRVLRATAERKKKEEHKAKIDAMSKRMTEINKTAHKRVVTVDGIPIERPSVVPSFADAKLIYDSVAMVDAIYWTWKYPDTKQYSYVQRFAAETYEIQNYNGEVMKSWVVITDPKTGEHLGSYNTKTKELSNDVVEPEECIDCLIQECNEHHESSPEPVVENNEAAENFLKEMKVLNGKIIEMQEKVG